MANNTEETLINDLQGVLTETEGYLKDAADQTGEKKPGTARKKVIANLQTAKEKNCWKPKSWWLKRPSTPPK